MKPVISLHFLGGIALVAFAVIVIYICIAWKQRSKSWTLGGFFLGGRNIGGTLTENTTWGTSFSFANGIFYFTVLGFYMGLSAIWLQIPWTLSVIYLAFLVPKILKVTQKHTLHGFIGEMFEGNSRIIASVVTTFGFLGGYAFEIYVSIQIICGFLGMTPILVPLAITFAAFSAAYCEIGGFSASAITDKYQNRIGAATVVVLVIIICTSGYNTVAPHSLEFQNMAKSLFNLHDANPLQVLGILCFASFVNLVDMSNWQNISANYSLESEKQKTLKYYIIKAAFLMFFFPAVFGVFFGYVFKGLYAAGDDQKILPAILGLVQPNSGLIGGVAVGLFIIFLLGTALSTANSFLLSSVQTVAWDLVNFKKIEKYSEPAEMPEEEQRRIVIVARRLLYSLAFISVLIFSGLAYISQEKVFAFQFVIFGATLALVPVTLAGLRFKFQKKILSPQLQKLGRLSMVIGFISGLVPFIISLFDAKLNVYALSPIVTLGSSGLVWLLGYHFFVPQKFIDNTL